MGIKNFLSKHLNLLDAISRFEAQLKGVGISPEQNPIIGHIRKLKHRAKRLARYSNQNFTYPRQSTRECARRARQIARGQLTVSNGLVLS